MRALLFGLLLSSLPVCSFAQLGRGNQGRARAVDNTVYLSGKVTLPDGSPPPDLVAIERACNGQVFPEGFTEPQGTFAVRLGTSALAAMEDASMPGVDSRGRASGDTLRVGGISGDSERYSTMKNTGSVDLTGCELRARLDGYRANAVILGRRGTLDDPNIGVIVIYPLEGVTGASVSVTSATAPDAARKRFERARNELRKSGGNVEKAEKDLLRAVEEHPVYAAAWTALGDARVRLGNEPAALDAYLRAVRSDDRYLAPYPALIKLHMRTGQLADAVTTAERYLKLNPAAAEERFYLALAEQQRGNLDRALVELHRLLADPTAAEQFPQARHVLGVILADRGKFAAAAEEWDKFLATAPESPASQQVRGRMEEWRALGVIE